MRVDARDGTGLAVTSVGAGPPLLCVPGGPGRAAAYLEDLGGLAGGRTLHLLDNRGSGGSELPADRDSLAFPRLADDVEDVRRGLGLERADVLGHSAGCPVVLLHAARYPGAVRRLVLVTPSGHAFGWSGDDVDTVRAGRDDEPWFAEAAEAARLAPTASPALRRELDRAMRPFWYGRWDARTQEHAATADRQMSLRAAAGYPPRDGYDAAAAVASLRGVDVPVLVVVGERDGLSGAAVAQRFVAALPDVRVAVVAGAGHFPWVDEPDQFRRVVEEFLAG